MMTSMAITDLQFAVLTALSSGRRHAYGVVGEVEGILQRERIPLTTVYSCIEALQERGIIVQDGPDEVVNGRARRYFRLTDEGMAVFQARAAELSRQVAAARSHGSQRAAGEALA